MEIAARAVSCRQDQDPNCGGDVRLIWMAIANRRDGARGRGKRPSTESRIAYLKLLPREYAGPRHIVSVSKRPDGRCEYEERPGEAPPNQGQVNDENVMTIYFVRAQNTANEVGRATD